MAKVPVTMSLRSEDLAALKAFAEEKRVYLGDAVGLLLELLPKHEGTVPKQDRLTRAFAALSAAEQITGLEPKE